ncbi:MAG: mechanosensitive ion channel protein MscS, partial [Pseudomonadota bacterium]
ELVKKAALEAAEAVPHRLTGPHAKEPEVWLMNFGASSLDFELVIWLRPESVKRPSRVIADYNWALEDALTKYGIEIPFPQRDLHVRTMVGNPLSDSGSE